MRWRPWHASTLAFSSLLAPPSLALAQPRAAPDEPLPPPSAAQDGASSILAARHDDYDKFFHFVTRPDIGAPKWDIHVMNRRSLAPGYWFVAPYAKLEQIEYAKWNGPHIYSGDGELIWSGAPMFKHFNTFDFRTVEVNGEHKYASLIYPEDDTGGGVIIDNTYNIYETVNILGDLPKTNMHDFTVVDDGTHALTLTKVYGAATKEESKVVGFDGTCKAGWEGFKELDVETSEVLFEWSAEGHIGLDESTKIKGPVDQMCEHGWDILHLNSIDKFPDGDYLLSARHTDAIYKVSHEDGSIKWRLGGLKSNFLIQPSGRFSRQHHARFRGQNETHILISLFDNTIGNGDNEHPSYKMSRGLLLALEIDTWLAHTEARYNHPHQGYTNSRGSLQFLPNGNAFVGWTYGSLISEHRADGHIFMHAKFKLEAAHTYRAYKFPWIGKPSAPPDVHSQKVDFPNAMSGTLIHVSWNGATEVASWNVYEVNRQGKTGNLLTSGNRTGFETMLWYDGIAGSVVLEALDAKGEVLGRSEAAKTFGVADEEEEEDDGAYIHFPAFKVSSAAMAFFTGAIACIVAFFASRYLWTATQGKFSWGRSRRQEYNPLPREDEEGGGGDEFKDEKINANDSEI